MQTKKIKPISESESAFGVSLVEIGNDSFIKASLNWRLGSRSKSYAAGVYGRVPQCSALSWLLPGVWCNNPGHVLRPCERERERER